MFHFSFFICYFSFLICLQTSNDYTRTSVALNLLLWLMAYMIWCLDPGVQVECFRMLNVWLLVPLLSTWTCCLFVFYCQTSNGINLVFLLFFYYYFCLFFSKKIKSHVLVIGHTLSGPTYTGRTVSNPEMDEAKKNLELRTVAPRTQWSWDQNVTNVAQSWNQSVTIWLC